MAGHSLYLYLLLSSGHSMISLLEIFSVAWVSPASSVSFRELWVYFNIHVHHVLGAVINVLQILFVRQP